MIFASHTLAEVEQLAGRIAVLDGGRLLACDTLSSIKSLAGAGTLEDSLEILTRRRRPGRTMSGSSQFVLTLRKLLLLFRRDFAVARSYRAAFVIELFQALSRLRQLLLSLALRRKSGAGEIASVRHNLFFIRAGGNCILRLPERGAQHL